jgi:hypothetical protein
MLRLWRADYNLWKPVLVDCPNGAWPALDADEIPVRPGTHFETEEQAWDQLRVDVLAWAESTEGALREAREELRFCRREHVKATAALGIFIKNRDEHKGVL